MVVAKEVEDGLGCTSSACSRLHYPYFVFRTFLAEISLVCSFEVVSDGHAVVWFKYLAGGEPGVGWVLLGKFTLVVVVADEIFEVDGAVELANLEIWVGEGVLGLQK